MTSDNEGADDFGARVARSDAKVGESPIEEKTIESILRGQDWLQEDEELESARKDGFPDLKQSTCMTESTRDEKQSCHTFTLQKDYLKEKRQRFLCFLSQKKARIATLYSQIKDEFNEVF